MIKKILKTEDGYNIVTDNGGKDDWVIGTGTLIHSFGSMNLSLVIYFLFGRASTDTCPHRTKWKESQN